MANNGNGNNQNKGKQDRSKGSRNTANRRRMYLVCPSCNFWQWAKKGGREEEKCRKCQHVHPPVSRSDRAPPGNALADEPGRGAASTTGPPDTDGVLGAVRNLLSAQPQREYALLAEVVDLIAKQPLGTTSAEGEQRKPPEIWSELRNKCRKAERDVHNLEHSATKIAARVARMEAELEDARSEMEKNKEELKAARKERDDLLERHRALNLPAPDDFRKKPAAEEGTQQQSQPAQFPNEAIQGIAGAFIKLAAGQTIRAQDGSPEVRAGAGEATGSAGLGLGDPDKDLEEMDVDNADENEIVARLAVYRRKAALMEEQACKRFKALDTEASAETIKQKIEEKAKEEANRHAAAHAAETGQRS